jgi:CO dehydrogenase maturation factor
LHNGVRLTILGFMRIAFVGKGGSGKTTTSALSGRYLASQKLPVMAIDADINQHLGLALGASAEVAASVPPLGIEIGKVKQYLRGSNSRIVSNEQMAKTTPPGRGSNLLSLQTPNPIWSHFERRINGVRMLATGPFDEADLGVKCYHSKVGAVELILNHLLDVAGEYVIVDMTAGADSFASGMFTKFDLTVLVAEPTLKGVGVYQQYKHYAKDHDVKLVVVGNKVETVEDVEFLRQHVGNDLLTWLERSNYVRSLEKGQRRDFAELEPFNLEALKVIKRALDVVPKDWDKFYAQALEFHRRNAASWANEAAGADLTKQIDPDFKLTPKLVL